MNRMNGDFCAHVLMRPIHCHSHFLFVSNKSFVTLVTRHFYCLRFACFRLKSSSFRQSSDCYPILSCYSLSSRWHLLSGCLTKLCCTRYMLCLCPARSCPAGSSAKSPHSAALRLYFAAKPCMGASQHLLGQQNFGQALKAGGANRGKSKTSKTECYGKLRYKPLLRKHGERE